MERELARKIRDSFEEVLGLQLTLLEVTAMTKIMTDGYEVYAVQKGDVTFLAWVHYDGSVTTKIQCW